MWRKISIKSEKFVSVHAYMFKTYATSPKSSFNFIMPASCLDLHTSSMPAYLHSLPSNRQNKTQQQFIDKCTQAEIYEKTNCEQLEILRFSLNCCVYLYYTHIMPQEPHDSVTTS